MYWVGKLAEGEAAGIRDSEDVVARTTSRLLRCGTVRWPCWTARSWQPPGSHWGRRWRRRRRHNGWRGEVAILDGNAMAATGVLPRLEVEEVKKTMGRRRRR